MALWPMLKGGGIIAYYRSGGLKIKRKVLWRPGVGTKSGMRRERFEAGIIFCVSSGGFGG
jgi:hypothetical protein